MISFYIWSKFGFENDIGDADKKKNIYTIEDCSVSNKIVHVHVTERLYVNLLL